MKDKTVGCLTGIGVIGGLVAYAMYLGIDGALYGAGIGLIGVFVGYLFGKVPEE